MAAAPAIIGAVAAVAGTSYGIYSGERAEEQAGKQRKEQRAQVAQAERAFAEEQAGTRRQEDMRRARARQLALMRAGTTGRNLMSTTAPAQPAKKTMLGT